MISENGRGLGLRAWAFTCFDNDPESHAFKERATYPPLPVIRDILLYVNKSVLLGSWVSPGSPSVLPVSPLGLRNWGSPRLFRVLFSFKDKESRLRPVEVPVRSQEKHNVQASRTAVVSFLKDFCI